MLPDYRFDFAGIFHPYSRPPGRTVFKKNEGGNAAYLVQGCNKRVFVHVHFYNPHTVF